MLRHLFPRVHWTVYGDEAGGRRLVIWRQWMSRCYSVTEIPVG